MGNFALEQRVFHVKETAEKLEALRFSYPKLSIHMGGGGVRGGGGGGGGGVG